MEIMTKKAKENAVEEAKTTPLVQQALLSRITKMKRMKF